VLYPFGLEERASLNVPVIDIKALLEERNQGLAGFMRNNFGHDHEYQPASADWYRQRKQ
jgi:hypothetical protein